ncbi:hypothetical protein KOI35_12450 [Actinoplanes bogorensis]|uniref:Uncharacterized protein n=1 Tax=Paractinoplanes bogorensis TaxID=1610840 RepID=A0ABS5YQL7_9ACTN|nr:hypothetical protein [Actinoplanes bogorensis]MBU2664305.1 hypothetical protein [Actinoplanes bogorensis]
MLTPVFYARPDAVPMPLAGVPALASWDKAGSPGQVQSTAFTSHVTSLVAGPLAGLAGPVALSLHVATDNTTSHDLDNYLFPLVPRITASTGRQFASVWGSKGREPASSITVGPARPVDDPGGVYAFSVRTTASAESVAYKQQIRDQVAAARPLPGGGVALQLAFVVGSRRAWPNLWKSTIDALGPVLGRDSGAAEWNARDGRIVDLGLHCVVDPAAGNDVAIAIRANTAEPG